MTLLYIITNLFNYVLHNGLGLFLSGVPAWGLMKEVLFLTPYDLT